MDLRAKIVDAVYENMATAAEQPVTSARHIVNAVMGVVEAEQERQKALFLQAAADQPGIPDYAHEALVRSLEGGQ